MTRETTSGARARRTVFVIHPSGCGRWRASFGRTIVVGVDGGTWLCSRQPARNAHGLRRSRLDRYMLPVLGGTPLVTITPETVRKRYGNLTRRRALLKRGVVTNFRDNRRPEAVTLGRAMER